MVRFPEATKHSLEQRLGARRGARWPQLASIVVRHRANFTYVDGILPDGTILKLCRLRYVGSAHDWRFAIYRASHNDYQESIFPTGLPTGTCEDATTPPAASTSATPPPGPDPRRINESEH